MFIRLAAFIALPALASAGTTPAPAAAKGGSIKIGLLVPGFRTALGGVR